MAEIKIGDRLVGDDQPTYVIAEIGVNHNGILDYAFQLIDASVRAGADAVKFQKRNLEKLYPTKYLENSNLGEKNLNYRERTFLPEVLIPPPRSMRHLTKPLKRYGREHLREKIGITFNPWTSLTDINE